MTYAAGEGGTVDADSESFVPDDNVQLTGATATADEGYTFVDWTEDGKEVSTEASFVPDATKIDADVTYTANFKAEEKEDTYPAVDFDEARMDDGTVIRVSAPEGAFPEGIKMEITQVDSVKILDALKDASDNEDLEESDVRAYEFDFYKEDEHGIEPRKDISVRFSNIGISEDSDVTAYHLKDENASATEVKNSDVNEKENTVSLEASEFSIYAIVNKPSKDTDGKIWIGDNDKDTFDTINAAVDQAGEGSTIHIKGKFEENNEAVIGAVIKNKITLDIAGNTTITGNNGNGITLESGSKIQTSNDSKLTMSNFKTALTVNKGAIMTDGTYEFSAVDTGIKLIGTMSGSDQSKMHVKVTANKNAVGIDTTGSDVKYKNVTLIWNGGRQDGWTYRNMNAENSHIEINDVWLYNSAANPLNLNNCYFKISGRFGGTSWRGGHVLAVYEDGAEFNNSTVVVDGSRINVIHTKGLTINNSTVTVQNSPDGGFNVNYGSTLTVHDSVLKAENVGKGFIAAGYSNPSNLYIDGSSVIETAGSSSADSIGCDGAFVVTGGSYKVDKSQLTRDEQIPTNGEANGNEKLTLFHLADPSVSSISMINANGGTYSYPVEKANEDGQKRVWGPKATVVFKLNNGNATFADGTTADKTAVTIRGNSLNFVKGNTDPGTPVSGDIFLGWYYKDSQGTEHPFTMDTAVTGNTEVYAKWNNISIVYHNGEGQSYIQSAQPGQTEMTVVGYPDIVNRKSDFAVQGKTFEYWTTAEDGTGKQYKKGDAISFENGETQVDLYAYYGVKQYSVRFSANGGTFSENSIFRNPDYFTIETDSYGGETALLKKTATYGQTLHDLTEALELDYNQLKPDADAVRSGYKLSDKTYWSTSAFSGEGSTIRFDDYKLWIFTYNGENPTITDDMTWYLRWTPTAERSKLNGTITLPADIWHGGKENGDDSTRIQSVKPGDMVTITAAVDVKEVKEKLEAIAGSLDVGPDEYSSIAITDPRCTFTAEFNIPEGFAVPDETAVQVSADGLGSCFDVTKTNISGRKITVTFELQSGIDDYQKLYDAVNSTGIKTALSESENDTITFKIAGLMVNGENKSDRDVLEIAGDVSGNFQAIATLDRNPDGTSQGESYYFAFTFKPAQTTSGRDSNADSKNLISISYRLSKPLNLVLPGDITTDKSADSTDKGEADSCVIRGVQPAQKLTFVGRLDVSSIKDQINTMEGSENEHTIRNVKSSFQAEITLGNRLFSNADISNVALTDNDLFEISGVKVNGSTVTVDMTLKDHYTSFTKLKETVDRVDDILEVRVPVTVSDSLPSAARITSIGRLSGMFSAEVVDGNEQVLYEPSFTWTAKQAGEGTKSALKNGKDDAQSENDNDTIAYTVKTPESSTLYGDISVLDGGKENTESDQIYQTKVGSSIDLIGSLNVQPIIDELDSISRPDHHDEIQLTNASGDPGVSFNFVMKAKFPDGITLPADLKAEAVEPTFGTNAFVIKNTVVNGQEVTVTFGLQNESVSTFTELDRIVHMAGSSENDRVMKICFPHLAVAKAGQMTVTVESLRGSFFANATLDQKTKTFNYTWNAVQMPGGKDFAQAANDVTTIAFTLNAGKEEVPAGPDQPAVPEKPDIEQPSGTTDEPVTAEHHHKHSHHSSEPSNTTSQITVAAAPAKTPATPAAAPAPAAQPAEVAGVARGQVPAENGGAVRGVSRNNNQSVATGDDSNMMVYGIAALAAAAGFAMWTVMSRRRTHR